VWLVVPDHLQCLPAHGDSVNNKCFTKSIKKLLMNKSDKTYCLQSLRHSAGRHQLNNISHLFTLVQSFPLNVQKSLGGHTQKSVTLQ